MNSEKTWLDFLGIDATHENLTVFGISKFNGRSKFKI
jgi:hypothetical protein